MPYSFLLIIIIYKVSFNEILFDNLIKSSHLPRSIDVLFISKLFFWLYVVDKEIKIPLNSISKSFPLNISVLS